MTNLSRTLVIGCSALALAACGPEDFVSPGTGGNVNINITPTNPGGGGSGGGTATVTPAGACPTLTNDGSVVLTDKGTISGPTGTWRNCELPSRIGKSVTLPKIAGLLYSMNGRVDVGCDGGFTAPTAGAPHTSTTVGCTTPLTADTNVTLTIEPGVIVYGATGQSWLAVNRGNRINAVGSATQPIVFTSQDNVAGLNTDNSIGQWGGVVLLGRGSITDCLTGTPGSLCERNTEGAANPATYGGADDAYNAGTMRFVQIRYSGFVLSANNELQALTLEGVGSGTTLENIQSHNSSDDGAEFFGGVVNLRGYVATGADDDSIDVDTGSRTQIQYALLIQRPGQGDGLFEIDSNGKETDTPRTNLRMVNFLARQPDVSANNEGNAQASAFFRGNSDITLANGIIYSPNNECIRLNGTGGTNRVTLTARSLALTCNATKYIGGGTAGSGAYTAADVAALIAAGTNNNDAFVSTLTNLIVNGTNEDGVAPFDATTLSSFFTNASPNHIGAAWSGNSTWYNGWTCNSSYASLGGGSACTSLPTN